MPPSSEPCDIPNCDGTAATTISPRDTRRQVRPRDRTDTFREGPVISIASNSSDNEIRPKFEHSFSFSAAGGWLYTEWSEVLIFFLVICLLLRQLKVKRTTKLTTLGRIQIEQQLE